MESFNPNPTLGAVQIGVLISYILFGVSTTQAYLYFTRYPDDPRGVRALTAFICPYRSMRAKVFFAFRIYVFTKKVYIPLFIWFMAFLPLLGGIILFALTLRVTSVRIYVANWEWLVVTNWSLSVATDLMITTTLVVVLRRQRSRAHNKTVVVVDKLILWTIETGLLTSVSSILTLAFFVSMKTNYIWLTFYTISTGLFPNSLLASLNSRASLRAMQPPGLQVLTSTGSPSSGGVHIKTESHVMHDIQAETTLKYPDAI
ncbi:hypothetical protein MSAN_01626500 [Mycena sanguinolenta]|uniref:DUF6534 domain-containing protein n=1 Tax=Mycena sanguinolenta TaxID=230812 RepID=A0A8H6Y2Q1_9AGAR|nr:hypothetical protein MSAN_01626500 [Mycena sanguinolenta]